MTGRTAVYAGSFDPPTLGHLDVVRRGLELFDGIIVAVGINSQKRTLFSSDERVELLRAICADPRVQVEAFDGLLVDYCRARGARVILRGLRAVTDFDYELSIGLANRDLAPTVETVFVLARADQIFVSSSLVREIARMRGDVARYAHPTVCTALDRLRAEGRL